MIRTITIICASILLLLYSLLAGDDGKISANMQSTANINQEFNMDVLILKKEIFGFAMLEIKTNKEFEIVNIPGKKDNFTFTYENGVAKCVWLTMPKEEELRLNFKCKATGNLANEQTFNYSFSFIKEGKKETTRLVKKINIINPNAITAKEEVIAQVPTETKNTQSENNTAQVESKKLEDNIAIQRTVDLSLLKTNNEIKVDLSINKGKLSGFGKLQENMPMGFTAKAIQSSNAVFSFVDQKVKYLWMNLPGEEIIKLSYKIVVDPNLIGEYFLTGDFSYIINDETQKKDIEKTSILLEPKSTEPTQELADNKKVDQKENTVKVQPEKPLKTFEKPKQTGKVESKPKNTSNTPKSTPHEFKQITKSDLPASGLIYKIQIAAGKVPVNAPEYFKKLNNITENILVEQHEGWTKYTVGKFGVYKEARDYREVVRDQYNVTGPFVTAYNNSQRITVQEALMISNQKWYR